MKKFIPFIIGLSVCFARPLYVLAQYSRHSEFFSYILLIPLISLYLIWLQKSELPPPSGPSWKWGAVAAFGGLALLAGWECILHFGNCGQYWAVMDVALRKDGLVGWHWSAHPEWESQLEDYLTFMTGSYLMFLVAGCLTCFGCAMSRALAFPIAFLVFMIPMPSALLDWSMAFFQHTSAVTALGFLKVAFMPVFLDNLVLNLPGFQIIVAPECSGIHSTMVLLITAALAGHLFLRSGWKRAALVVFVIPLAILRNGFRIFVISELCVQISHDMINSPIHRKGGPIFFALSLIPFFALLYLLRKSELPGTKSVDVTTKVQV